MSNAALLYRPQAKWPTVIAFVAAVTIHLGAVALASHRKVPSAQVTPQTALDVIGIDEVDSASPIPQIDETIPPPPSATAEFVDDIPPSPAPLRRERRPVSSTATVRPARLPNPRALALHAPRPDYPYEARRRQITGSGVVALTIDGASGAVVDAEMEQSIGNSILDQFVLSAFRRWRFKVGTPPRVYVPITFTLTGAQF